MLMSKALVEWQEDDVVVEHTTVIIAPGALGLQSVKRACIRGVGWSDGLAGRALHDCTISCQVLEATDEVLITQLCDGIV